MDITRDMNETAEGMTAEKKMVMGGGLGRVGSKVEAGIREGGLEGQPAREKIVTTRCCRGRRG